MTFHISGVKTKNRRQNFCWLFLISLCLPCLVSAQSFQITNFSLSPIQGNRMSTSPSFQVNASIKPIEMAGSSNRFTVLPEKTEIKNETEITSNASSSYEGGVPRGKYDASNWVLRRKYDELVAARDEMLTSAPKTKNTEQDQSMLEWMEKFRFELETNVLGKPETLQFEAEKVDLIERMYDSLPNLDNLEKIEFQKVSDVNEGITFPKDKHSKLLLALQNFLAAGKIPETFNNQEKLLFAQNSQYAKAELLKGNFELDASGVPIFLDENKKVVFEDLSHLLAQYGPFIIDESFEIDNKNQLMFGGLERKGKDNLHAAAAKGLENLESDNYKLTDNEKKSLIIKKQFRLSKENPSEFEIWQESAKKLFHILIALTIFEFMAGIIVIRLLLRKCYRVKKFLKLYSPKDKK